jgi:hypothetical protein
MWEACGWKNEDLLWAGAALWGGIGGQNRGTCGAVASAGVCLGLRHRRPLADKNAVAKAREAAFRETGELAKEFIEKFGAVACVELVGVDFSEKGALEKARQEGRFQKCHEFLRFVVGKLFELEEKREPAID